MGRRLPEHSRVLGVPGAPAGGDRSLQGLVGHGAHRDLLRLPLDHRAARDGSPQRRGHLEQGQPPKARPLPEEGEEVEEELAEEDDLIRDMMGRIQNLEDAIADIKSKESLKEELSAIEAGNKLTVELSQEIPVEVQAELNEPSAEPIVSNPEAFKTLSKFKIGSNRKANTMDRVLSNLNK